MISVIILTWNSSEHIGSCLKSLFAEITQVDREFEVFVVDGNSQDETLEILAEYERKYSYFNTIELEKNMGTTVSRNRGIEASNGEYLLFLDSDTLIKPGSLSVLTHTLERDEGIGIAAPRLFYKDGSVQPSCKKFPTLPIKLSKFIPYTRLRNWAKERELYEKRIYSEDFDQTIPVDHCISAAWLIRKSVINEIGNFDESIFYAPEDVDFCLRTWLGGYKVIYQPNSEVIHETQRAGYKYIQLTWKHFQGLIYFFKKYNYFLHREKIYETIKSKNKKFCEEGPGPKG